MSVDAVLTRIAEIQAGLVPPATTAPAQGGAASPASFASLLGEAGSALPAAPGTASTLPLGAPGVYAPTGVAAAGADPAARMIQLAQGEVGQTEQPPGSNDSPRIAQYRTATAGAGVGPWCAYFVSWLSAQAGRPLGEAGQGFGSVDALRGWAERTGRTTQTPAPGELIVWDEHVGLVTGVDADGTIHTIEGNSSNAVSARTYGRDGGGALTYVKV